MNRNRDDLPTLRVTNVSEDASEDDLRDLFSRFGKVFRVYIGRDRETGIGKGYAFVSFEDRANAERAMHKVHGMGYDNLILNCQWSREYSSSFDSHPNVDFLLQNRGRLDLHQLDPSSLFPMSQTCLSHVIHSLTETLQLIPTIR
jgi:RNA recognition motif-containing protein